MMVNTWTPTKEQLKAATPKRVRKQRAPGKCVVLSAEEVSSGYGSSKRTSGGGKKYTPTEDTNRDNWLAQEEEARCPGVW